MEAANPGAEMVATTKGVVEIRGGAPSHQILITTLITEMEEVTTTVVVGVPSTR